MTKIKSVHRCSPRVSFGVFKIVFRSDNIDKRAVNNATRPDATTRAFVSVFSQMMLSLFSCPFVRPPDPRLARHTTTLCPYRKPHNLTGPGTLRPSRRIPRLTRAYETFRFRPRRVKNSLEPTQYVYNHSCSFEHDYR